MKTGVILLNFGEPEIPSRENVVPYLERIFLSNMSLEGEMTEEHARERAHKLAERRAPGLLEEYEEMGGGSPLIPQAQDQADALAEELGARGYDVETYTGMQYTEPFISDAVEEAKEDGVKKIIGIPVYPLCGRTTTIESLEKLEEAVESTEDWNPDYQEVSGWHEHPTYVKIRVDNLRGYAEEQDLDLNDPETEVIFSAHGTPVKYLNEGSRYDQYVEEFCDWVSDGLGLEDYTLGYQNHANRDVDWTQPETEEVVEDVDAERIVVEPLSFMHEQSETLSELDLELREEAEELGLEFYRVPVPHDDERFAHVLADLSEPFISGDDPNDWEMGQCQCKETSGTMCYRPANW